MAFICILPSTYAANRPHFGLHSNAINRRSIIGSDDPISRVIYPDHVVKSISALLRLASRSRSQTSAVRYTTVSEPLARRERFLSKSPNPLPPKGPFPSLSEQAISYANQDLNYVTGRRIAQFELVEKIGEGGMGCIAIGDSTLRSGNSTMERHVESAIPSAP